MQDTILFICSSVQLANEVKKLAGDLKENVEAVVGWYPDVLSEIRIDKIKAIVALPVTANALVKKVGVPIVPLFPPPIDLLEAIYEGRIYNDEISYIGYSFPQLEEDLPRIERFLGIRLHIYTYNDPAERKEVVRQALSEGTKVAVVTGELGKHDIERDGATAIVIPISVYAISQALRAAKQIVQNQKEEQKKRRWLELLLDLSYDGVIATDETGIITTFNKTAEKCLGIRADFVLERNIQDLDDSHPLKSLLNRAGTNGLDEEMIYWKDKSLLVRRSSLLHKGLPQSRIITFRDETQVASLQRAIQHETIKRGMVAKYTFQDIIGTSSAISDAVETSKVYANTNSTILITGETGVGKEIFAQSIHNASSRKKGPFVAINCATIPENLLESELFGYEGGSFTGARKEGKRGLFEYANMGTLFLDEIGEMPFQLQARLLRVLQDKEIRRIGADRIIPVDVRVIAATNQDLWASVNAKQFRQDLFFRLNVLSLKIPPLRERIEDIPFLITYFISKKAEDFKTSIFPLNPEVILKLKNYHWPGNVRQLEGFVERYVTLCKSRPSDHLLNELPDIIESSKSFDGSGVRVNSMNIELGTLEDMEKQIITKLLSNYGVVDLANKLGVSRTTLWRKLRDYGYELKHSFKK